LQQGDIMAEPRSKVGISNREALEEEEHATRHTEQTAPAAAKVQGAFGKE
jgi:hypothetical protein